MPGKHAPLVDRFWAKVDRRGSNECWPWTGATVGSRDPNVRYGRIRLGGQGSRLVLAHRLAYEFEHGSPPLDGFPVCHTCHNSLCCNPAHLVAGTVEQNNRDAAEKRRINVTEDAVDDIPY